MVYCERLVTQCNQKLMYWYISISIDIGMYVSISIDIGIYVSISIDIGIYVSISIYFLRI